MDQDALLMVRLEGKHAACDGGPEQDAPDQVICGHLIQDGYDFGHHGLRIDNVVIIVVYNFVQQKIAYFGDDAAHVEVKTAVLVGAGPVKFAGKYRGSVEGSHRVQFIGMPEPHARWVQRHGQAGDVGSFCQNFECIWSRAENGVVHEL